MAYGRIESRVGAKRGPEHIVTRKHALPRFPPTGVTTLGPTLTRHY